MIVRNPNRQRFVIIAKDPLEDERLSWGARGLHAHLMTKPDSWRVVEAYLVNAGPTGRTKVRSLMRELLDCGYVVRGQGHRDDGTFDSPEIEVFETPREAQMSRSAPLSENPSAAPTRDNGANTQVSTADGFTVDGSAADGESDASEEGLLVSNEGSDLSLVLGLLADRRIDDEERRGTVIRSRRAYRPPVLADVRAKHQETVAALIAANSGLSAEQIADEVEATETSRTPLVDDTSTTDRPSSYTSDVAGAERRRDQWIDKWIAEHPGEPVQVPPLSTFVELVEVVA